MCNGPIIHARTGLLLACLFLGTLGWISSSFAQQRVHVAVAQIVEHTALDTLRECLKKALEEKGYVDGKTMTWTYENAQGNPTTAAQIAHKLTSLEPTVIVTLSTPMSQAFAAATQKIPLVFGAVTDPSAAKLTGHKNITGLTDRVLPDQQLDLINEIVPAVQTIGVIFNSGEANSQKQVQALKRSAEKRNIRILEATVSKSSDVPAAARTLVGQVDAFLLPTDNTVITALESILKIGNHNKIPVFGSDVDIVRRGAVAAYGVDWCTSGKALAEIVIKVLKKTPPNKIPIENPQKLDLYVNPTTAQEMGAYIPDALQQKAEKVFQ